jgi:hypothetical protein
MDHPRPILRGGHGITRDGHHARGALQGHAQPDAGLPDANTPFGSFWWIGASSTTTSAIPNSGVRMEADVITAPAEAAGGCFSVWTSDTLSNGMWGQIGYSACALPGNPFYDLTAFFQVWDLSVPPDGQLLVDQESDDIAPGLHSFAMYVQSGTTWVFAVDGNPMGACDMGSATANAPGGVMTLSEEGNGVAGPFTPPAVAIPVTMEVLTGTAWGSATTATVVNTAGLSGVVGNVQDPTLADDQIVIGGQSPTLDAGVPLWNGTLTDGGLSSASDAGTLSEPFVQIGCPAPNATVGGTLFIPITTSAPSGIASVAASVDGANDLDGGSTVSLCNLTAPPYDCVWDTTGESEGPYFLDVIATDGHGNTTYETILVDVSHSASSPCPEGGDGGSDDGGGADASEGDASDGGSHPGSDGGTTPRDGGGSGGVRDAASDAADAGGRSAGCSCDAAGERSLASGPCPVLVLLLSLATAWRRKALAHRAQPSDFERSRAFSSERLRGRALRQRSVTTA